VTVIDDDPEPPKGQINFRQCHLRRDTPGGYEIRMTWLPVKFAIKGKELALKGERGWVVTFVGHGAEARPNVRKLVKGHRRATGDSDRNKGRKK